MNIEEDFSKYNGEGTVLRRAQKRLLDMMVELDRICEKHDIPYIISDGTCLGAVRHGGFIPWDDDVDISVMRKDYKRLKKVLKKELPDNYFLQTPKTDKHFYRLYTKIVDKDSFVKFINDKRRERLKYKGLSLDIFPLEKVYSYKMRDFIDRYYYPTFLIKRKAVNVNTLKRAKAFIAWPVLKGIAGIARILSIFSDRRKITHSYGTGFKPHLKYSNIFPPKPILFEGKEFLGPAKPHEYLEGFFGDYWVIPPEEKREVHAETIEVYENH
jgi:lipopolysaccharide cholinephosphotransferase